LALCVLLGGALFVPISTLAYDQPRTPLNETKEYELASHVVEGQIKSVRRLAKDDRTGDSAGPRFSLDMKVKTVLKPKKDDKGKPVKIKNVSVVGWVVKGEGKSARKLTYLPRPKDDVIAFLKRNQKGTYEALFPTGFMNKGGGGAAPGPGRGKEDR
jgi:hypothetical protein